MQRLMQIAKCSEIDILRQKLDSQVKIAVFNIGILCKLRV